MNPRLQRKAFSDRLVPLPPKQLAIQTLQPLETKCGNPLRKVYNTTTTICKTRELSFPVENDQWSTSTAVVGCTLESARNKFI